MCTHTVHTETRTKRQQAMQIAVHNLRYGREYGIQLQVLFITIVYTVICPFLLPVALIYFALAYVVYRYQVLYVFERSYESGGMHWPAMFDRLCLCLWGLVFFTACMLFTRHAYTMGAILLLILTPTIYQFHKCAA